MEGITKIKIIQVRISEQEKNMLNNLCEKFGCGISEMIRSILRDKYTRTFPAYVVGKRAEFLEPEEELTPEQMCEKAGGTVGMIEGIPSCTFRISESMTGSVPLTKPELYKKYKK